MHALSWDQWSAQVSCDNVLLLSSLRPHTLSGSLPEVHLPQTGSQPSQFNYAAAVLQALFAKLREVHVREDVKAIVVTGANGRFSAGFDVSEFANPDSKGTDPG